MKKKALLIVLALCMIVSVFAGCSTKRYNYKYDDYIKLGEIKNITIDLSAINKEIKSQFESAASADKETKTYSTKTEGVLVEDGDVANINYVGKVDGKEFEGGKAEKYDLTIGSGTFIDGFEDGLIGADVGETLDIKVTFPKDYGKEGTKQAELNGKEATFTVTINSIKRTTYPSYTDANVKKYFETEGYKTIAEFEAGIIEDVKKDLVWEKFYESCKVKQYPKKELETYYNNTVDSYTNTAHMLGVDIKTYASYMGYSDEKAFFQYLASMAKSQVKQELILFAVLEEKLPVLKMNNKEYKVESEALWQQYVDEGSYEGDFDAFTKEYTRESIEVSIYYEKVISYIVQYSVINDDVTKNGLVTDKNGTRYYENDVMKTGWMTIDVDGDKKDDKCYFDTETGYLAIGGAYAIPEGEDKDAEKLFYEFTDKGVFVAIYEGFYNNGQTIRYFENGVAVKGWRDIDGDSYYFFDTTYAAVGDVMVKDISGNDILGRFDKDGKFQCSLIGWVETEEGIRYYYAKEDGTITFATREYEIDGITFYFGGKDGYLANDPTKGEFANGDEFGAIYEKMYLFYKVEVDGETRYALKKDYTGIYTVEGVSYYFVNGVGQFGWQKIENDMYFFSSKDGKMMTGEQKISDVTYNFGADGKLTTKLNGLVYDDASNLMYFVENVAQTGVQSVKDGDTTNKYYFDANGFAQLGWIDVDGDEIYDYYARDYKIVVSQTATIDGVTYKFDADGKFTVEG